LRRLDYQSLKCRADDEVSFDEDYRDAVRVDIRLDISVTNIQAQSIPWISVVAQIIRNGHPQFHGYPSGYLNGYPRGYPHGQLSQGSFSNGKIS